MPHTAEPPPSAETAPTSVNVAGNDLQLFVESPPMIRAISADIAAATERVWVEVYIFADDDAGRHIAELLARKAAEGLDVRVLYDALGSSTTSSALFNKMAAAGVKIHAFHSLLYALRRLSLFKVFNRRNHRKLLIVDRRIAYFGGMNITDTSGPPAPASANDLSDTGGWHDVHVRLAGPQAEQVAASFDRSWRRAHHEHVPRTPRYDRRVRLPSGTRDFIRFYDAGPGLAFVRADRVFTRLISLAERNILISMAYFLPTRRVLRAILRARRRGRRITIIVPGRSDVPLVQRATCFLYARLLKRGIKLYERQRSMLHSKAVVVDDTWSIVGSCNLDARSLEHNLEFLAVIRSAAMARAVRAICEAERAASCRITRAACVRDGLGARWLDRLAYFLRRWL